MAIVWRFVLVLFLVLGAVGRTPVGLLQEAAATSPQPSTPALSSLAVSHNEATIDFPAGIDFSLDASTAEPIASLELLYREPGVETWSVELPVFDVGATQISVTDHLGLSAGELPPGVDVNYRWRLTSVDGDVAETAEQTILWADDRYDWTSRVGPHVAVYTYGADPQFQQAILDTAERTVDRLSTSYSAVPAQQIRIWAYTSRDDLYGALPPNSEPWIAGSAYPGLHLILAILPTGDLNEVKRVVPHEISHQVLGQATANPFNNPPKWLDEGLAVYSQESGRDRFYRHALDLAATGEVPSLATLNGEFPYDPDAALAAYAYSLSAVIYILDTYGDEGMARLIAAFPEGITYDDTIREALGVSFEELDRQWREDLVADAQRDDATIGTPRSGVPAPTNTP